MIKKIRLTNLSWKCELGPGHQSRSWAPIWLTFYVRLIETVLSRSQKMDSLSSSIFFFSNFKIPFLTLRSLRTFFILVFQVQYFREKPAKDGRTVLDTTFPWMSASRKYRPRVVLRGKETTGWLVSVFFWVQRSPMIRFVTVPLKKGMSQ